MKLFTRTYWKKRIQKSLAVFTRPLAKCACLPFKFLKRSITFKASVASILPPSPSKESSVDRAPASGERDLIEFSSDPEQASSDDEFIHNDLGIEKQAAPLGGDRKRVKIAEDEGGCACGSLSNKPGCECTNSVDCGHSGGEILNNKRPPPVPKRRAPPIPPRNKLDGADDATFSAALNFVKNEEYPSAAKRATRPSISRTSRSLTTGGGGKVTKKRRAPQPPPRQLVDEPAIQPSFARNGIKVRHTGGDGCENDYGVTSHEVKANSTHSVESFLNKIDRVINWQQPVGDHRNRNAYVRLNPARQPRKQLRFAPGTHPIPSAVATRRLDQAAVAKILVASLTSLCLLYLSNGMALLV